MNLMKIENGDNMKISIVTVTYNCENSITNTIESVLSQSYKNIEYIIIDGDSIDNTKSIINKFQKKDSRIFFLSEPDKGIYNAMNKSINYLTGEYTIFLNSGDIFCNENIIKDILKYLSTKKYDLVYGNIIEKVSKKDKILIEKMNLLLLFRAATICHQTIFFKSSRLKENEFNETYKLCADREWIYRAYKNNYKFLYCPVNIVYYDTTGVSSLESSKNQVDKERELILKHYYPVISILRKILKLIR